MGRLDGKIAVITGAGAGMGKSTALLFAKEGAKIVVVDYVKKTAEDTAAQINSSGGQAVAVIGDVSQWKDIDTAVVKAVDSFGRLDSMVNNAGVFDNFISALDTDDALWNRVIDINLKGVFPKFIILHDPVKIRPPGPFSFLRAYYGCPGGQNRRILKHYSLRALFFLVGHRSSPFNRKLLL
jgi:NAD(P)-dependent dehydrogenase (short-subunit alcohol dehydrogenase family)